MTTTSPASTPEHVPAWIDAKDYRPSAEDRAAWRAAHPVEHSWDLENGYCMTHRRYCSMAADA